jgi:hypothetical protein
VTSSELDIVKDCRRRRGAVAFSTRWGFCVANVCTYTSVLKITSSSENSYRSVVATSDLSLI